MKPTYPGHLAAACLCLVGAGCSTWIGSRAESPSDWTLVEAVLLLDDAVSALEAPGADYRKVLESVGARLPRDRVESIGAQIATFLERAPAPGDDFRCGPEFMLYRARQELWRMKDILQHASPSQPEPQFCYAVPFVLDVARPFDTIEIYGYDMDTQPLEMFLVNGDVFENVTPALIGRTHYHLTYDLGKERDKFSAQSQGLSVAWGHLLRYTIPLVQSTTPVCPSAIETIPGGKTIDYPPLAVGGGGRLPGVGARVSSSLTLDYESNKVDATVCMTVTDGPNHRTTYSGCGVEYVYTSDPDQVIEGVFGNFVARVAFARRDRSDDVKEGASGGPVREWTFSGLGGRGAGGGEVRVSAQLNGLRVVSTAMEGCVSAIAYAEAKRTEVLGPETVRRLDPQVQKVDAEILKLRPRFAPQL